MLTTIQEKMFHYSIVRVDAPPLSVPCNFRVHSPSPFQEKLLQSAPIAHRQFPTLLTTQQNFTTSIRASCVSM